MSIIEAWQRVKKWVKEDKGWMLYSAFLLIIAIVILRDNRIKSERLNKIIEDESAELIEIRNIKDQILVAANSIQINKASQVLGETIVPTLTQTPTPTISSSTEIVGILEVKRGIPTVNIYESPLTEAVVLETKTANTILFFDKKENGWYQIDLEENKKGWIQAEMVNEIKS